LESLNLGSRGLALRGVFGIFSGSVVLRRHGKYPNGGACERRARKREKVKIVCKARQLERGMSARVLNGCGKILRCREDK
jgi:hypothetical protein